MPYKGAVSLHKPTEDPISGILRLLYSHIILIKNHPTIVIGTIKGIGLVLSSTLT